MHRKDRYPWRLFWLLLCGGLFGVAAVLPYAFAIFSKALAKVPLRLPLFLGLQFVQSIVLLSLAVGVGLLIARQIGLGAPRLEAWLYNEKTAPRKFSILSAVLAGAVMGASIIVVSYFIFAPLIPQLAPNPDAMLPLWKRFLACFYGGLDEEILIRLFLLSLVLWSFGNIWRNSDGKPSSVAFWTANTLIAVLFGVGHLPAAKQMMTLTPIAVTYVISLNGIAALLFGYLYWKRGLESAIVAHFSADIVLHVIGPVLLKGTGV